MRSLRALLLLTAGCGSSTITTHPDGGGVVDASMVILPDARLPDAPLVLGDGSPADGAAGGCLPGLTAITLTPADSSVTLDGKTAAPIGFAATGQFTGGATMAIAGTALTWSVTRDDDTSPGSISGAGVLAPFAQAGGVVTVHATDGCVSGATTVTFSVSASEGTPAQGWPTATVMSGGAGAPVIIYPSDETRIPRNVYRTLFQWQAGGMGPFRLIFTGPGGTYTVYTDGVYPLCAGKNPAAGCWEASESAWNLIAGSNAGKVATLTVDRLDTSGANPVARRSAAIKLGFSRRDVPGAIFYWSTDSKGIRRGRLSETVPEDYLTGDPGSVLAGGDTVHCAACHVLSRDGKYLAAPVESDDFKSLWITEVTVRPPPKPLVQQVANTGGHGFATFSPNDDYLVVAWNGKMWQIARQGGAKLADLPLGGLMGTHPDWSPLGNQLVFATGAKDAPDNAGLALMSYGGGTTWGMPQTLVASAGGKTNLFPQFSPDGSWIVFSRGDKGSHDDRSMQLFLVRAQMGSNAVPLTRASCTVNTKSDDCLTENYEPTWAPKGDLDWIAFNSERAYGVVAPAGQTQLWIAAVDTSAPGDPSYPAFRVPFQGLDEANHRAFWTQDIRDTEPIPDAGVYDARPAADARACVAVGAACDPGRDTCCTGFCETSDDGETYFCLKCTTDADNDGHIAASCGGDDCCDSGSENAVGCADSTAPTIYHGAMEKCGDGIDQDCSGSDLICKR